MILFRALLILVLTAALAGAAPRPAARWWKGNLHTHTLWSDGDDYPEMVVDWYKQHGYHFLALSDHNLLQTGPYWISATNGTAALKALDAYRQRFGAAWVHQSVYEGGPVVRLKTLEEFAPKFEERGRFLLIPAVEITSHFQKRPVHLVGVNLRNAFPQRHGTNVQAVLQRNIDSVFLQRERTGQPMFPHVAHPNFGWVVTAEDLMGLKNEQFFEVYNGHPLVNNEGDAEHPGTERMWDIILTQRLARLGEPVMFGLAVDDAHHYQRTASNNANAGRGWVMVRAAQLTPLALIGALERGDFYASTGVVFAEIRAETNRLSLVIAPDPGVTYTTQFIGTRAGFDPTSKPILGTNGEPLAITRTYSKDIGVVFAEVSGFKPSYTFQGDELYVRAKVISSKPKTNFVTLGEMESAWVQPQVTSLGGQVNRAAAAAAAAKR